MRQIKFRAWDVTKKKMVCFDDDHKILCIKKDKWFSYYNPFSMEDYVGSKNSKAEDDEGYVDDILEQYTGLKDKNGKEIYEGDVIKYPYYPKQEFEIGVVRYDVGGWWIIGKVHSSFQKLFEGNLPVWPTCLPDQFEVIGNIHENPELLKQ